MSAVAALLPPLGASYTVNTPLDELTPVVAHRTVKLLKVPELLITIPYKALLVEVQALVPADPPRRGRASTEEDVAAPPQNEWALCGLPPASAVQVVAPVPVIAEICWPAEQLCVNTPPSVEDVGAGTPGKATHVPGVPLAVATHPKALADGLEFHTISPLFHVPVVGAALMRVASMP